MSIENGEGSSLGHPMSSDDEIDAETMGGASSTGNGSGMGIIVDSDLSDDEQDAPEVDRYGFMGGKQFTGEDGGLPTHILRKREMKWLDMIDDWEKWMTKKPKKVRERCRKGIPSSIRSRAWQYMCGSKRLCEQNVGKFKELDEMEGDPKWLDVIEKDLDRQFPFHEMFAKKGGNGQQDLYRILKAYSIYNPRDGYCQGQAPVAAVLLMHMPAEEAFWAMVHICERYLTGYYSPGLEAVQIDGEVLFGLMKKVLPSIYKHMKKHRIEPILYMTEWFMCIFSRTLPWSTVLRVWDMFFCEGVKILFRVALVLLKNTLGSSQQLADSQGLYETMEKLKHIPDSVVQEDFLVSEMLRMRVFEKDLEAEHSLSLARRKAVRQRQLSSEKAAAMARDIEIKKKTSKVNPAKEWVKERKRKEKERIRQNDTDSVISAPISEDIPDGVDERVPTGDQVGNGVGAVEKEHADSSDSKKKKKKNKDKKHKSKDKLTIDTATTTDSKWATELQSPDIEREYEFVDKLSTSSGSPTKAWRTKTEAYTDRDNMSEETLDIVHSSKKKKKDKKKKSKGKDKRSPSADERTDDDLLVATTPVELVEEHESKEKKGKKKKSKNKDKSSSAEEKLEDASSNAAMQDAAAHGESKRDKKKDRKKSKDVEVEDNLPGMVLSGSDIHDQEDAESVKSVSKKNKKKGKKDKKEKREETSGDHEVNARENGVIHPRESPSDGSVSSPMNLSDYEVVERQRPPSDSSRVRGSEKRMGLVYSEEDIQRQFKEFGPIPEIPSFEEVRQRRISKEREHEERKRRKEETLENQEMLTGEESTSPEESSANVPAGADYLPHQHAEAIARTAGPIPHSMSNGMEPTEELSKMTISSSSNISNAPVNVKAKYANTRDYHSFDYGTTV